MREKINPNRIHYYINGYFKPKGKYQKRIIHKKLRKMKGIFRPGIMNALGISWTWC